MAIREKLDETIEENRILGERVEKNESLLLDYEREIKKLQEQNSALMKEVTTAQKARESECQKLAQEVEKLSKANIEYKKKCDGFFQQVVTMNSKQKEYEEELNRIKRAFDHQAAELEEKKALNNLMSDSVSIMTNK